VSALLHRHLHLSGYRCPAGVILAAVRWYVSYPLSARQVTELLAERGVDVSPRTVLNWTQTFGPRLAVAARVHRLRLGWRWYVDEVLLFRGIEKRYLYRAVDQHGQVIDVLLVSTATWLPPRASFVAPWRAPRWSRPLSTPASPYLAPANFANSSRERNPTPTP
jgi:transposase-like protein